MVQNKIWSWVLIAGLHWSLYTLDPYSPIMDRRWPKWSLFHKTVCKTHGNLLIPFDFIENSIKIINIYYLIITTEFSEKVPILILMSACFKSPFLQACCASVAPGCSVTSQRRKEGSHLLWHGIKGNNNKELTICLNGETKQRDKAVKFCQVRPTTGRLKSS